jgi:D-xylose transport system permease protein
MTKQLSLRDFSLFFAIVAIWTFFSVLEPSYIGSRNLSLLAIEMSTTAVAALGVLLIILCGHIDLAIGSGVGLFGGLAAVLVTVFGWPAPLALSVSLIAAVLLWTAMGQFIVSQKIPSFIITLGGLLIFKGIFWLVINVSTIPVKSGSTPNLYSLLTDFYLSPAMGYVLAALVSAALAIATLKGRAARRRHHFEVEDTEVAFYKFMIKGIGLFIIVTVLNQFRGVPLSGIILCGIAFAIYVLTQHTAFGRHLYAIGGNEEAAYVSGVPVNRTIVGAFAIAGALVAITGFLQTAKTGYSTTAVGQLMELDAIAACVIGGVSLKGGRGTVMGVMAGALIMSSLINGLTLLAADPAIKFIARGSVLVLAVWMDVRLNKR